MYNIAKDKRSSLAIKGLEFTKKIYKIGLRKKVFYDGIREKNCAVIAVAASILSFIGQNQGAIQ
jgi:hypothetical protein